MAKLGFIGIGNMGGALAKAAAKKVPGKEILVSSKRWEHARDFAQEHQLVASTNESVARESKFVILGVKPQYMEEVLGGLKPILEVRTDAVLVTMAAGLTMDNIASMLGGGYPIIRIMPNTPAGVGQGLIVYDANDRVNQADLNEFLDLMEGAGLFDRLPEHLIDAASAVAGCSPAFYCQILEAMADGGVACGLPREKALVYAAQAMLGTAQLVLTTGQHPGALKDAVCSPGGSTIQGVRALERGGLRSSMMEAVIAAYEKNKEFIK